MTFGSAGSDVVVIGAGIVGLSAAYYLARRGLAVTVLEALDVAAGTSGSGDGIIILQSKSPGPVLDIALKGAELYPQLLDELDSDVEYERRGSLIIIEDEIELSLMQSVINAQRTAGIDVQLLERQAALQIQPGIADHVLAASFLPDDASVNQLALCFALARAARAEGARFRFGVRAAGVLSKAGSVCGVRTDAGDVLARKVLLAAGVWTAEIAHGVGLELPIIPRKGHLLVSEKVAPFIHTAVLSAAYVKHKHRAEATRTAPSSGEAVTFSLEQARAGTLFIGSSRELVGFDVSTSPEVIRAIAHTAMRLLPRLADVHIIRSFAGLRPYTTDGRPIIGEASCCDGLFIAAGHEGDGIALGPITGKLIGQLIAEGAADWDLRPFSPNRFETSHLAS